MNGGITFRLLGALELSVEGERHQLGGARQDKVLALLLLNGNRMVTTTKLVDALWDDPPATGRRQVHNAVARIRQALGRRREIITTDGPGYRLRVADDEVDAYRFSNAVETARREAAGGSWGSAARTISTGLKLWRGPALNGVTGPTFTAAAARLDEERLAARELLAACRLEMGEAASLVPELTELIAEHPLRENLRRQLMLALYRSGRQAGALELYEQTRTLLADELGLVPSPDLDLLHQQVLRNDPALDLPATSRAVGTSPAPVTQERSVRARPNSLPRDVADFVGRAAELELLRTAISRRHSTIVTLDGMAGIGKSALAVRLAHLVADLYPDGLLFVDLHGYTDGYAPLTPSTALDVLLRGVGVPPDQLPADLTARADRWRSQVATNRVLIVLDNAKDADQVRQLLPGAPGAGVIVTSRRRLAALDSTLSLSLTPMAASDAAALFRLVAGRQRTEAEPERVAEVVRLCGSLPLAVRIAASRLRHRPVWSVRYLAERLRDTSRRLTELSVSDRSVLAAFNVSYRHLSSRQQRTFRFLGTQGALDFDGSTVATKLGRPVDEVETLLEDLLDVHMVAQREAGRYWVPELLGHYARSIADLEEPREPPH